MIITRNNIVHYLLAQGLLDEASVVDGDVMVVDTSRRNNNFRILRKNGGSYFLKQVQTWQDQDITSLQREATCYWLAATNPEFKALLPITPRYHRYDHSRSALVIELLPEGETLSEYHLRLGEFPVDIGRRIGNILGNYHRNIRPNGLDATVMSIFQRQTPWVLSIHQLHAYIAGAPDAGKTQLSNILQQHTGFQQQLDTLRAKWKGDSLIHGDVKWDNFLLLGGNNRNAERHTVHGVDDMSLKIIDWELADFGDPCWDAGAVLQSYISYWILSIPVTANVSPDELVRSAPYPIETMQPAIREFWKTYTATLGVAPGASKEMLERSLSYAAARMIQTAYEYLYQSSQMTPSIICLLQVSLNILENPAEAVEKLLNM